MWLGGFGEDWVVGDCVRAPPPPNVVANTLSGAYNFLGSETMGSVGVEFPPLRRMSRT